MFKTDRVVKVAQQLQESRVLLLLMDFTPDPSSVIQKRLFPRSKFREVLKVRNEVEVGEKRKGGEEVNERS